jgi:hypothetical protein
VAPSARVKRRRGSGCPGWKASRYQPCDDSAQSRPSGSWPRPLRRNSTRRRRGQTHCARAARQPRRRNDSSLGTPLRPQYQELLRGCARGCPVDTSGCRGRGRGSPGECWGDAFAKGSPSRPPQRRCTVTASTSRQLGPYSPRDGTVHNIRRRAVHSGRGTVSHLREWEMKNWGRKSPSIIGGTKITKR